ncbi:hypothetical protein [Azospirillum sp.]|uniref:hypothetical protein n=1 Tax=Azospirillum sp. TaxID=34012 RepID=UPI003D75C401
MSKRPLHNVAVTPSANRTLNLDRQAGRALPPRPTLSEDPAAARPAMQEPMTKKEHPAAGCADRDVFGRVRLELQRFFFVSGCV